MPMDYMTPGGAIGDVANRIQTNGNTQVGAMKPFAVYNKRMQRWEMATTVYAGGDPKKKTSYHTYSQPMSPLEVNAGSTLRRDEWKALDEAVLNISRSRLVGVQDLISDGLIYQLGNAMGTTVLEWHDMSDSMEADLTMDGVTRSKGDRPVFQYNYLPIPIIHVDYEINARALAASRNMGNPLDSTSAENAARRVAERLEEMLFTNTTKAFGELDQRSRNSIYSYVNHPDRNPVTLTVNWDADAKTGKQIVDEVMDMKKASIAAKHYGPWNLYIPTGYETTIDADYSDAKGSNTIRERILKISNIKNIKTIDSLAANTVLLVQMTSDVVRLVRGLGMQNVQWSTEGNMVNKYKVLTIQVPQIRSDQDGNSGVTMLSA